MRLGDKVCTIAPSASLADAEAAKRAFTAAPWAIIVEMDEWPETSHGLLLPESVSERLRPTTGTVIGVGCDWRGDVGVGDRVIVDRALGLWYAGWEVGGYVAGGQVRIYGTATMQGPPIRYPALDGIMGRLGEGIQAIGRWVLIRREPPHQTEFGLELPDSQKYRSGRAVVVSGSGRTRGLDIVPGSQVVYNVHAAQTTLLGIADRYPGLYPGDHEDYCFVDSAEILTVINGTE